MQEKTAKREVRLWYMFQKARESSGIYLEEFQHQSNYRRIIPVKKYSWHTQCRDKHRYPREKMANKAMKTLNGRQKDLELEVYLCGYCYFWHVGKKVKTV